MELVNDVKIFRPGDPEFEELAKSITPLHMIRNGLSHEENKFYADIDPVANENARRKETVN